MQYKVPLKPIVISTQSDNQLIKKLDKFLQESGVKDANENKMWHSLYWQKQSGHHNHTISYTLDFPENWDLEHAARPGFVSNDNIEYQVLLDQDFSAGFLFGSE